MKKMIFIVTVIGAMIGSMTLNAQAEFVYLNNKIKSGWYIAVGLHKPGNLTNEIPGDELGSLMVEEVIGAKNGIMAEVGLTGYFGNKNKKRKFRTGIDINAKAAAFTETNKSLELWGEPVTVSSIYTAPDLSVGLGPIFSFNPTGDLVIDLNIKLRGFTSELPSISFSNNDGNTFYSGYDQYYDEIIVGSSFGLRARSRHLYLSAEWTNHKVQKYYSDSTGNFGGGEIDFKKKHFDLTIGAYF